jgi:uncharacterized protein (DUF433 family)
MAEVLAQHIEKTPGGCGGSARIAGHSVRVLDIVVWHELRGYSPDEVVAMFPGITLADVHAALTYHFDHREEIQEEFHRNEKESREFLASGRDMGTRSTAHWKRDSLHKR